MFYDGYGEPVWTYSGDRRVLQQPFQYKGQFGYFTDVHTDLCYCINRYYDPYSGRWTARDPSGLEGGVNVYGYCDGNPVMGADPTGLDNWGIYAHGGIGANYSPLTGASRKYFTSGANSFQARAMKGAGRNVLPFAFESEFYHDLGAVRNVTRLDIHSHGREAFGMFSGTLDERVWSEGTIWPVHHRDGPFSMAAMIKANTREWEQGAVIRLFGCNQQKFADKLSKMLTAFGRPDITVIGANGHVYPVGES